MPVVLCQAGLLDGVPSGDGWCSPRLDLLAQRSQIFAADFAKQSFPEHWIEVAVRMLLRIDLVLSAILASCSHLTANSPKVLA